MNSITHQIQISVIVPCYNQSHYLSVTLKSVLKQTVRAWECIIVDDGSTDNTSEIALEWTKNDNRFSYVFQENMGLAEARNAGVRTANGKYILPLDADDLIHKDFLSEAIKAIELNKNIKIVYSDTRLFGIRRGLWTTKFNLQEFMYRNLIPCTALFYKKDWKIAGGYNSNMVKGFEDWDFWMSLIKRGGQVYRIEKFLFYYRQRDNSMASKLSMEDVAELKQTLAFNHPKFFMQQLGDPLTLSLRVKDLERQKMLIENSIAYRIGSFVMRPLKLLHLLLKKC